MGLLLMFSGAIFFFSAFELIVYALQRWNYCNLKKVDIYTISMRLVSTLQSIFACVAGVITMIKTQHDIMQADYWIVNAYSWFAFPYFYYDVYAMYAAYRLRTPELEKTPHRQLFPKFFVEHKLMMAHHILFPLFYFPVIVYFRGDRLTFFCGCLLNVELAIPFISLRAVLLQLGKERSVLYLINGCFMVLTFACCRVVIFPALYYVYGRQIGVPFLSVPFHIPPVCNFGTVVLGTMQLYWLYGMILMSTKYFRKRRQDLARGSPATTANATQGQGSPSSQRPAVKQD